MPVFISGVQKRCQRLLALFRQTGENTVFQIIMVVCPVKHTRRIVIEHDPLDFSLFGPVGADRKRKLQILFTDLQPVDALVGTVVVD